MWEFKGASATMMASFACFIFEGAAYNIIFLGRILPAMGKEALVLPFGILFNIAWGLSLVSYVRAHLADPGKLPKRWQDFVQTVGDKLPLAPARHEWQPGVATYCERCEIARPERAHHCAVCGFCVLRMDHHCAWIDNCVGFKNHKFFFLLVIYTCTASFVAFLTSLPELLLCVIYLSGVEAGLGLEAIVRFQNTRKTDVLAFLVSGLLSLFFVVLFVPMVCMHIPLALHNTTAIESNYVNMGNPFDQGSRVANVAQIFGNVGPDWVLPVLPMRPTSDGISFARGPSAGKDADALNELLFGGDGQPLPPENTEEIQMIWRHRYAVRPEGASSQAGDQDLDGPLTSLAKWWTGGCVGNTGRASQPLPGSGETFGSKREIVLGIHRGRSLSTSVDTLLSVEL